TGGARPRPAPGAAHPCPGVEAGARRPSRGRRRRVGGRCLALAGRPRDGARAPVSAWTFARMTQADAERIAGWHYPGEYAFYDADFIPESAGELLDPARRGDQYHAARNADGELEGFAQFEPVAGATEIGLGLRPDLTGRGLGQAFTEAVIDLAWEFADMELQSGVRPRTDRVTVL